MVAIIAVVVVAVAIVMLVGGGKDSYEVTAEFENASQLVKGNQVLVGGLSAGSVKEIDLGPSGQALVTLTVDDDFAPLPRGTTATVRLGSLSSVAGRQVQLTLPPQGADDQGEIEDGGTMTQAETVSAVDLDEIFNTLDTKTVKDFKAVIVGFRDSYAGKGIPEAANEGARYLNPLLSTSRQVFAELTRDTPAFESLIVDTASLSGLLSERHDDLTDLVSNASGALGAIGRERESLARAISELPGFMRQANTTFVNLRATLDDLDPLTQASLPVADRLGPFFSNFRAAAADAVPTIRDLDQIVRRPGKANDLVELTRLQVPLAKAGVGTGAPDCGSDPTTTDYVSPPPPAADQDFTQGALGETVCALRNSNPQTSNLRAYTPELVGWFDGFSTSGLFDASGPLGRINTTFNAFSPAISGLPDLLSPIDPADLIQGIGTPAIDINNNQRCPGSTERDPGDGSTPFTDGGALNCDPSQTPQGP